MLSFEEMAEDASYSEDEIESLVDEHFKESAEKHLSFREGSLREKFRLMMRLILYSNDMDRRKVILARTLTSKNLFEEVPVWSPAASYNFPIADIPVVTFPIAGMQTSNFSNVRLLATGSSGISYLANYGDSEVVVKEIRKEVTGDEVCIQEFDMEHGLLARFNHPNIEKIIGSGSDNGRKFLVLECLKGGTLSHRFKHAAAARRKAFFCKKATFTLPEVYFYARQLAGALNYLHNEIHPDAVFIHRDLKPDNIAFLEDGNLVLFDFGLTTVIKRGATSDVAYQMTGETGSLRYMAPEVALNMPYNEKVDQYSFGVILWEMARDETPFIGASRASHLQYACRDGERPHIPFSWPSTLKNIIQLCWHQDFQQRPNFIDICTMLDGLVDQFPRD